VVYASEIISDEIKKRGPVSFARFMELALYCPDCGYYEVEKDTTGRRGDFFTSVSVGNLFGELLAFQFSAWLEEIPDAKRQLQIVEGGAHSGTLARDILSWLNERQPKLCDRLEYVIIEPSARRREWQRESLQQLGNVVRWVACPEELADQGVAGVIFSNEMLDAMPVHRLGWNAAARQWFEWGVALEDEQFVWVPLEIAEAGASLPGDQNPSAQIQSSMSEEKSARREFRAIIPELPPALEEILPDGFVTEVCPAAVGWWKGAASVLRRGRLVTIDYGLAAEEFLSPERRGGTLRAYCGHHLSAEVLLNPGEQDLTAHVNFTRIQSAGECIGLRTEQITTQEKFLTRIAERFCREHPHSLLSDPGRVRQFQTLTHPEHLGSRFRVLIQSRD
jgi:SAM-dependent MidA family methyltransferase